MTMTEAWPVIGVRCSSPGAVRQSGCVLEGSAGGNSRRALVIP